MWSCEAKTAARSQRLAVARPWKIANQEGLATVIAGAISFWVIEDFPDSAKFLSEAERAVVVRRLQSDDQYSAAGEQLQFRNLWRSIMDLKTWFGS